MSVLSRTHEKTGRAESIEEYFLSVWILCNDVSVHSGRNWTGVAGGNLPGYLYDSRIVFSSFSYSDFSQILCSHWEPGMDD